MDGDTTTSALGAALTEMLRAAHLVAPDALPDLVARTGRLLGASEAVLYLVDYEQVVLSPVPSGEVGPREPLSVEGSVAGRVFRSTEPVETEAGPSRRLWVPLLDGVERLGVLEIVVATRGRPLRDEFRAGLLQFGHLTAELLVSKAAYTDAYEWVRRKRPMTLAAELQHSLLPPLTFGTDRLVIAGQLSPTYEVGGDAFDYAADGNIVHLAIFDALGHGLQSSLLAHMAVAAYRNARRAGLDLQHTAHAVDTNLAETFGAERFVTAVIAQLDVDTGHLRWINAGHPEPMLLRDAHVVKELVCPPALPLGLNELTGASPADYTVAQEALQPADRLLLVTDGVDEARDETGEPFGRERLAELAARESASGLPTPEVLRRLHLAVLRSQTAGLQDDATTVLVEWLTGKGEQVAL